MSTRRLLAVGVGILIVGRLIDFAWHAANPEFETAADQVRAHAVVWIGAVVVLSVSVTAVVRGVREGGFLLTLGGTLGYVAVAVWHFIEHANRRDPDLPHLLLLVTNLTILAGAAWVGLATWRRSSSRA